MARFVPLFLVGLAALCVSPAQAADKPKASSKVYELRIYHVNPGRMKAMNARFRDHTCKLFEKHGIKLIGFWQPADPKEHDKKLIYIIAHDSKEAAAKSWKAFVDDPVWKKVYKESQKDGKIVQKVESTYLNPTDYSLLK